MSAKRTLLASLAGCVLLAILVLVSLWAFMLRPVREDAREQVVLIREGRTLEELSRELENRGIVRDAWAFRILAGALGYDRQIKAGEYLLSGAQPPLRILDLLRAGAVITHPVTIPEGYTARQIAALLEERGLAVKERFLARVRDPHLIQGYGINGNSLEGYLYPDTYHFARGIPPQRIIDTLVERFHEVVDPVMARMPPEDMEPEEVVVLASIVEKETGRARERPLIASVFLNRLRRGMRLQSDPTVIYGLEDFDGNLTRKDLRKETPYNTYTRKGLPPGPIANPGLASILAVLNPAETDYLYFVSKNDGSHHFSKTLREHVRAVNTYQRRGRSTP